jgi:ELWxxDGT repeat protein
MNLNAARALALVCLLASLPAVQAQPAFLVRDINTAHAPLQLWDQRDEMAAVGNQLFFVWDDGIHGNELWESDGPSAVPHLVRDICPGACSANPKALTAAQGKLFFIADEGVHGRELWRSDGTETGTSLAWDFDETPKDSLFSLTYVGDTRMLAVVDFGDLGQQLNLTDGTMNGTRAIAFSYPGPEQPAVRILAYSPAGLVLYAANSDIANGVEPWVFDKVAFHSTPLGDIYPGGGSSLHTSYSPASTAGADAIAAPWGGFIFSADDGSNGRELWIADGTRTGTRLLTDLYEGAPGSLPHGLTALNGAVYFAATGLQGQGLWRTDGTAAGTTLVKNLGASSSGPLEITVVGNLLFFLADDPAHGEPLRLFRSDGTEAGTFPLPGAGTPLLFGSSGGHHGLSAVNGQLLLLADDGTGGSLWKSDGTPAVTLQIATVGSHAAALMEDGYAVAGGNLYLRGGEQGEEIWRSDGTAAGTVRVQSGPSQTSSFLLLGAEPYSREAFAALGGQIYFSAFDGTTSGQLWKSDGTAAGTVKLETNVLDPERFRVVNDRLVFTNGPVWATDGTPGGAQALHNPSWTFDLTKAGNSIFFSSGDVTTGKELWRTDGTPAGTSLVADLVPGKTPSNPRFLTEAGGKLFFEATEVTIAGSELWVSDGTAAGSFQVADLGFENNSSSPRNLTAAGGLLYFSAATGFGRELWKSDGTADGTVMVKDIQPGPGSSIPDSGTEGTFAAPAGGPLFFAADDFQTGEELWKSDGTTEGTTLVQNLAFERTGSYPRHLTAAGSQVYFVNGTFFDRELWVSDGTEAGTHRVKDINPGQESSRPGNLTAVGSVLLFSAFDPAHGVEAWRTDGTAVGTRRVTDIAPGPLSSSPLGFTAAGANVYFAANDNTSGFELWALPQSNILATFEDAPTTYWAWHSIEAVAAAGITLGCGEGLFCAERTLTRAEMGVFLGRALHGSTFVPPTATGTRFADVPASYWAAGWIEQIATDGVTQGCAVSPLRFCPEAQVARAEMAIFLLRARHGGSYTPPPATGTRFTDVPVSYWAAAWIEQLAAEGITNGCDVNLYCPNKTVGRAEMAVFLGRAFNLPLP